MDNPDNNDTYHFALSPSANLKLLFPILNDATEKLFQFVKEPALVAECPHKFNDSDYDDFWNAAQIGNFHWEQSHFLKADFSMPIKGLLIRPENSKMLNMKFYKPGKF